MSNLRGFAKLSLVVLFLTLFVVVGLMACRLVRWYVNNVEHLMHCQYELFCPNSTAVMTLAWGLAVSIAVAAEVAVGDLALITLCRLVPALNGVLPKCMRWHSNIYYRRRMWWWVAVFIGGAGWLLAWLLSLYLADGGVLGE